MSILSRVKSDFFEKSHLTEYRNMLIYLREHGYCMVSVNEYFYMVQNGLTKGKKVFINRHDVDNSPPNAIKMFYIEKDIFDDNGHSTFYFRLCTLNPKLMKIIVNSGFEVGYHYEEIAEYAKKNKVKNQHDIRTNLSIIRQQFLDNIKQFRKKSGVQINTCASHGDFVNRYLNITNTEILDDELTRRKANIIVEAYDSVIENTVSDRITDALPIHEMIEMVKKSVDNNSSSILLLTHPGHWKVDYKNNIKKNIVRLYEGLLYH